jgi:hypothetical protein
MDPKRRATIIKNLAGGKGLAKPTFDATYTPQNREWFVTTIVDSVLARSPAPADNDVEGLARKIINDANQAVKLERDFTVGVPLGTAGKIERKNVARRVEVIYGVIAQNPALSDVTQNNSSGLTPLRRFLSKRRYRAVVRMCHQINPNSNGFMFYPDKCKTTAGKWRLNKDARPLWQQLGGQDTPLMLRKPDDPHVSIGKIFEQAFPADPCDGNLLDCSNALCCLLLDSLLEAVDAKKFCDSMVQRGQKHLLIINPNKMMEEHCVSDDPDEPDRVFAQGLVKETDFQVGDHLVLENHGLYESVLPGGLWIAEHSLVTNTGNRKQDDGKGIRFGGHGLIEPMPIGKVYDELLKHVQTGLHRIFKIAEKYFAFRKKPASIPANKVEMKMAQSVKDFRSGNLVDVEAFKITDSITYDDYVQPPKQGRPFKRGDGTATTPIVILDIPSLQQIAIAPQIAGNTIDRQLQAFSAVRHMTFLFRPQGEGGGHYYDQQFWKIMFADSANKSALYSVFGGKNGGFRLLTKKEMPTGIGRYFRAGNDDKEAAWATRPHDDSSNAYLTRLETVGAIVRKFPP